VELGVTKGYAACLRGREGLTGSRGNQGALLFGERGEQVQHKRVHVWPKLSDPKGHLVSHEAADEMNVPTEAIWLGNGDTAPMLPGCCKGSLKPRSAFQSVGTLASRRRMNNAPAVLIKFVRRSKKTFSTLSAQSGHSRNPDVC
jgi:hypothetical protein